MDITVILCTYNRDLMLKRTLESIAASVVPANVNWEVLIVDNNSNDRTRVVAEEFCAAHARFRYLFEGQQGKSFALNAGIRHAAGRVLVFTDDDVTVEPTWLWNVSAPLYRGEVAGVGGRTLGDWTTSKPPRWLPRRERYALAPLALFDLGVEAGELNEAPFGNNMAFLKSAADQYGGFRTDLGPAPGSLIRGEDSEFGDRLLAAGLKFRYEPSAVVYHPAHSNRVDKKYFLRWWFDKARSDLRVYGLPRGTRWFAGPIPLYLLRRIVVWTIRWLTTFDPSRRFECKIKVWGRAGEITECYNQPPARDGGVKVGLDAGKLDAGSRN